MMSSADGERESSDDPLGAKAREAVALDATAFEPPGLGSAAPLGTDRRGRAVWSQWLTSMASDAEAALAAAIAYREMDQASRETFLDSLELDAPQIDAPAVALYAPLLSVERDPERRARLIAAIGPGLENARPRALRRALSGRTRAGRQVFVLVIPLYLDFVQVLACQVFQGQFEWVRHDPIVSLNDAPQDGVLVGGIELESVPFRTTIDDLAEVVVSHRRSGGELPEALLTLADLFGLDG